jgi:hypothetical protein
MTSCSILTLPLCLLIEFGHFAEKDTLIYPSKETKETKRTREFNADQMGMELLDRVPEYSMGSMVGRATGFQGIYPTAAEDMKFIEDWSYGRVKLIQLDRFHCIFYR